MERWEYKVVSTDVLVKRPQDHDIAVYKEEADSRRESARGSLEDSLVSLGTEGWELATITGEFAIFKKRVS